MDLSEFLDRAIPVTIANLHREYPNGILHSLFSEQDIQSPSRFTRSSSAVLTGIHRYIAIGKCYGRCASFPTQPMPKVRKLHWHVALPQRMWQ